MVDTHLLLWAANEPKKLSAKAMALMSHAGHVLFFSAASIWEVVIKSGLGRDDFKVDARLLRRGLMDSDYTELPVTSAHAVLVESLPLIHKDPFDRILIAQATAEGFTLLTAVAQWPCIPARLNWIDTFYQQQPA